MGHSLWPQVPGAAHQAALLCEGHAEDLEGAWFQFPGRGLKIKSWL
jgi:hypothetical protein